MDMLKVCNVCKSFGSKDVIKSLSFSIPQNSIFGFVGKNGAGKTTTMKMILGLLKIDSGEIYVDGKKVTYGNTVTNKVVGYLPDVPEFYDYMTTREYLKFCGSIAEIDKKTLDSRVEELLELVGLANEKKRIKGFSRGMKQRLGIAQALIGKPKLLICDEPTSALDPVGRKEILDILLAAKKDTTVIFSTHILSDVERICDEVAFLNDGKIALTGTIEEIKKQKKSEGVLIAVTNKDDIKIIKDNYKNVEIQDDYTCIIKENISMKNSTNKGDLLEDNLLKNVMRFVLDNNISVDKVERCESTLENLFMEVTK